MGTFRGVVAIDGPSGTGKSTVSRRLATALEAAYLDTGAMYRAATWAVLQSGVDPADADGVAKVVTEAAIVVTTDPTAPAITLNGAPVDGPIRGHEVTAAVSAVSAVPAVRAHLVDAQRALIGAAPAIVVEGRDIGTVVVPDAVLKVYLTADPAERARRRSRESATEVAATAADLARRDAADSSRTTDPLRRADDAVELDTTALTIDEVVAQLLKLLAGNK